MAKYMIVEVVEMSGPASLFADLYNSYAFVAVALEVVSAAGAEPEVVAAQEKECVGNEVVAVGKSARE